MSGTRKNYEQKATKISYCRCKQKKERVKMLRDMNMNWLSNGNKFTKKTEWW